MTGDGADGSWCTHIQCFDCGSRQQDCVSGYMHVPRSHLSQDLIWLSLDKPHGLLIVLFIARARACRAHAHPELTSKKKLPALRRVGDPPGTPAAVLSSCRFRCLCDAASPGPAALDARRTGAVRGSLTPSEPNTTNLGPQ
jgi:hypothetical protein